MEKTNEITFHPLVENNLVQPKPNKDELMYTDFVNICNSINFRGYTDMCNFVKSHIHKLLSSAVDKHPTALKIITHRDFLIAMDMIDIHLNREYTNRFNRVYRAYVINPSKNAIYNQTCADLMYKIALKMNKTLTESIMETGLCESYALWITVNRYSSTDERRNIRRMVRAMQHISPTIMNEQLAVDIFAKTFNDQLTNLFISIMTDRFDYFDSEEEKYVYSTISNAILAILNTMNEEEIQDILMEYNEELKKSGVNGRFSLRSINSEDYSAICRTIDELESRHVFVN